MVKLLKARDIDIVMIGVPERGLILSSADFYEEIADKYGLPYDGDVLPDIISDSSLKSDAIHPNAKGNRLLAESTEKLLRRAKRGIPRSDRLNALPDGACTQYVGTVICRQQPATSSRVTFYTVEDESGFVNLVVWHPVFERYSVLARMALLMGVTGKVQSQNNVVYLIADELWDPQLAFRPQGTSTRSFC